MVKKYDCSYYQCSNKDGNKANAIRVYIDSYLNIVNFTRNLGHNPDIFTLVQYNMKLKGFRDSFQFVCKILGLEGKTKDDIAAEIEAFDTYDYTLSDEEQEAQELAEELKQEEAKNRIYQEALKDDIRFFNGCVPYLHDSWCKQGILSLTRVKFDIRYSYNRKRIIFPIRHYLSGEIIGINTRTIVENYQELDIPKYKSTKYYPKSKNIFGLFENRESIIKSRFVTIFESEKSVFKRDTVGKHTGDYTAVAIQGHVLSDDQAKILGDMDLSEYIVSMDKDVTLGEIEYMCSKLYAYGAKKVTYIYDTDGLLGEKDSPVDKGYKVYQQLFDSRIYCNNEKVEIKAKRWL